MPIFEDDNDIDTSYDLSSSEHIGAIRKEALECIDHFFVDKVFWADKLKIPKSKLFREEHVKVVMEMTVMDALAIAYYCLEKNPPDTVPTNEKGWDIKLCYECLKECAARWIPKCYAGGIVLVYLSMCHGVNFIPTLKKIHEIRAAIQDRERQAEIRRLMEQQQQDDQEGEDVRRRKKKRVKQEQE